MHCFKQSKELLDMIKFEHTVFALPFAFLGAFAAADGTIPARWTLFWILLAMVGARTAAMTFNRLVDADVDAQNPRTQNRALPAGRVSHGAAWGLLGMACALLGFAAGMLGPLPWKLAPLALFIILGYSLCKRFTSWSHVVLGISLAGAPLGAWIAVAGRIDAAAWFLAFGVMAWTAGFDILYALHDREFDQAAGLRSIPARLGVRNALWLSRLLHLLALVCWALFERRMQSHFFPWLAWLAVAVILVREQWVMREGKLEHLDHAFFTLNSLVGLFFLVGHGCEWLLTATLA
ncbi:MAG TPA: UbiA-like polyprenyltransferase [Holophaga sp.]|nr:UbiA-like polyprenyltransferase [Holophaga sp.]